MRILCRYFDGETAKEHHYELAVGIGVVTLIDPDTHQKKVHWPVDDLIIVQAPSDGTSGKLSHKKFPDARIIISSRDDWARIVSVLPATQQPRSYVSLKWRMMPVYLVLSVVFFAGFVIGVPKILSASVMLIPQSFEEKLGEQFVQDFEEEYGVCDNAHGRKALDTMISNLQQSDYLDNMDLTITVVQSDIENALAFPGKSIVVFGELIKNSQSPEELAFVIGHEAGHIKNRHAMRGFLQAQGVSFLLQMMVGDVSFAGGGVADIVGSLGNLHNSREHEHVADQFALSVASDIHMDHRKSTHFFERIGNEDIESFIPEWLSTHPNTKERIEFIKNFKPDDQVSYKSILNDDEWQALKSICDE